jgi:hypothetical protein
VNAAWQASGLFVHRSRLARLGVGSFSLGGGVIVLKANAEDSMIAMKGAFQRDGGCKPRFLAFLLLHPGRDWCKCCDLER